MSFGVVPMFVAKDFVRDCFVIRRAVTRQNVHARRNSRISARGSDAEQNPWLRTLELSQRTCPDARERAGPVFPT